MLGLTTSLLGPWRPLSFRRDSGKARPSRRFTLPPEPLEARITPTANLAIVDVLEVNSSEQTLTTINPGEWISIRADFTSIGLPSNASYRVGFTVNGVNLDSGYLTWGAGASGTQYLNIYWGTFLASPGTNNVSVTLDPDQSVAESSYTDNTMTATFNAVGSSVGNPTYTAAQIRQAYGINNIPNFGTATPDGTGQTITLVEAGNEPTIITDLDGFDQAMNLTTGASPTIYQAYGAAANFVNVYNQSGVNITADIANSGTNGVPAEDPSGHWEGEETLDVEWAHAIAPGARIDIIEVPDDANWPANLLAGDKLAASLPDVSAISNSFGLTEWSGETAYDSSTFVTPAGHTGVTFLTASNDNGANVYPSPPASPPPAVGNDGYYPATSPNVVSVGGTQLTLNNNGYGSETGWSYPSPTTIDDEGGANYTQAGSWTSQSGGFSGPYSTAPGGSSSSATWTMPITTANTGWGTELSATWTANSANATNATYTIYDGTQATGTILGTVTVDQTKAPTGTADGNFKFQELGVFFPTLTSGDGTLTVVLNAGSANGKVVADAIGSADGWASTGGPTRFETEPSYQLPFQSTGFRTSPDISFDASETSGVDTYFQGSLGYGSFGTSLSSPCWAGLIAIINQGRVEAGGSPLDSPTNPIQTLQALYSLPSSDYNQITTGYNGFSAGAGYNDVTGLGTPIANLLVPDMVAYGTSGHLVVTSQTPTTIAAGTPFTLTANVENASGDTITSFNSLVTLTLTNSSGSLLELAADPAVKGVVTFSNIVLGKDGAGQTLGLSSSGVMGTTTGPITVTVGSPSFLSILQYPTSGVMAGASFTIEAAVEDAYGNVETGDSSTSLTAELLGGPGSLLGKTTITDSLGIATFNTLADDRVGTLYLEIYGTLSNGLFAGSPIPGTGIVVIPAAAARLVIQSQPSSTASVGQAFANQPVILEEDQFGNLETGDNTTVVTATLASGSGPLQGTTAVVKGGVATFTNLLDKKVETLSIGFGGPNLTSVTSNPIVVGKALTTVAWSASSATAIDKQSITLTATVAATSSGTIPTGSVTFLDGSTVLHTSTLNSKGQATFTTASLPLGTQSISVMYSGDPTYVSGTSPKSSLYVGDLPNSDYDGDGKSDIAIFDQTTATFEILYSGGGSRIQQLGNPADKLVPVAGDYTGDGKTDLAVYDQTVAEFFILYSNGGSLALPFGNRAHVNIPVVGDFDGDGKTDIAIYDQTAATFYILKSGGGSVVQPFGNSTHVNIPVAGDFDGDGKTDIAVYDQTSATFEILYSGGGSRIQQLGNVKHINVPIAADFDGDGKTDLAIYDQSAGVLYALESGGGAIAQPFGNPSDVNIPVAGDYDGDGKTDIGIYDATDSEFFILYSDGGSLVLPFGNNKHVNRPV